MTLNFKNLATSIVSDWPRKRDPCKEIENNKGYYSRQSTSNQQQCWYQKPNLNNLLLHTFYKMKHLRIFLIFLQIHQYQAASLDCFRERTRRRPATSGRRLDGLQRQHRSAHSKIRGQSSTFGALFQDNNVGRHGNNYHLRNDISERNIGNPYATRGMKGKDKGMRGMMKGKYDDSSEEDIYYPDESIDGLPTPSPTAMYYPLEPTNRPTPLQDGIVDDYYSEEAETTDDIYFPQEPENNEDTQGSDDIFYPPEPESTDMNNPPSQPDSTDPYFPSEPDSTDPYFPSEPDSTDPDFPQEPDSGDNQPTYPTSSPDIGVQCELDSIGSFGYLVGDMTQIEYRYQVEVFPGIVAADAISQVEKALTELLLPVMFPDQCTAIQRRQSNASTGDYVGISSVPPDFVVAGCKFIFVLYVYASISIVFNH